MQLSQAEMIKMRDGERGGEMNMQKLYEIPKGSKIRIWTNPEESSTGTFHHVDGLYSFCTFDDKEENNAFHLSRHTPLVLKEDGVYEIEE